MIETNIKVGSYRFPMTSLADLSWSVAEGSEGTNIQFSIYDSDRTVLDSFSEIVFTEGLTPRTVPEQPGAALAAGSVNLQGPAGTIASLLAADGWSQAGIASMLGTLQQESGFVPAREQIGGGGGIGILQWTGPRRTAIEAAGALGTLESETNYLINEMRDNYPSAYASVKSAPTIEATKPGMFAYVGWGIEGDRYLYADQWLTRINSGTLPDSIKSQPIPTQPVVQDAGQTIDFSISSGEGTVYLSYLHSGISHDADTGLTTFTGHGAQFVLSRAPINTEADKSTHSELLGKVLSGYGVELEWDNPSEIPLEHITIAGLTPLAATMEAARAQGKRVYFEGTKLRVTDRQTQLLDIVLEYGKNISSIQVSHEAESTSGDTSTRSSKPSERTRAANRSYTVDPLTGGFNELRKLEEEEDKTQIVKGVVTVPLRQEQPAVDGVYRSKGIRCYCTVEGVEELIYANPDDAVKIQGVSVFLDRVWVMEVISHSVSQNGKLVTQLDLYSPLKPNLPPPNVLSDRLPTQLPDAKGWVLPMTNASETCAPGYTSFGDPRPGRTHLGIDLYGPVDNTIYAANAGVVRYADRAGGYGRFIEIQHANGYQSNYAHLASIGVSVGQTVQAGQPIGVMGGSGASGDSDYDPHLHFEVLVNGAHVDPRSVVSGIGAPCS